MARGRRSGLSVWGLLVVDKPPGPTSHDIVDAVRRGTGQRRVGHAGTLDPLASGVLVLALGQATRLLEYLSASDKEYVAELTLGVTTDTYDATGTVVVERPLPDGLSVEQVEEALARLRGTFSQRPPVYSAVKVEGQPAYRRARAGEAVALAPRPVTIHELALLEFAPPKLALRVRCSAGTYVRSLAHDLGEALGCGAMLSALRRTASGRFSIEDAVPWQALVAAFDDAAWQRWLLPADLALEGMPRVPLGEEGLQRVRNGQPVSDACAVEGLARGYAPDGRFAAVLSGDPPAGVWRPVKVFAAAAGQDETEPDN